jgi:cell division transport system permease protein
MSILVMDGIATETRILGRILQETLGGIRRTGWMNLVIVITMASILSIFGTFSAFVLETQLFVENIGSALKISVYASDKADLDTLRQQIQQMENVRNIEVIPKEKAWEEMRANYQVPDIQNPLPNTLHVQMTDQRHIEPMVQQLRQVQGVEDINYAKSVLEKLANVSKITSAVGITISLFLGVLTLFIISNTIHLLIQARSREIEIMRMMGVGNWYIRLPFLFQGAGYGLLGAFIAYIPLSIAEHYINLMFQYFQFSTSNYSQGIVFLVLLLMGIFVGAGGSAVAVHRYLKI